MLFSFLLGTEICLAETLTLGIHPYLPPTEILDKFTPLADYLSRKLGVTVRLAPIKSRATGLVPAKDSDYDSLREILSALERTGFKH